MNIIYKIVWKNFKKYFIRYFIEEICVWEGRVCEGERGESVWERGVSVCKREREGRVFMRERERGECVGREGSVCRERGECVR